MAGDASLLHWAAERGDAPMLSILLGSPFTRAEDVNAGTDEDRGNTPLHAACARGRIVTTRMLLEHPYTDVNMRRASDGLTPLMLAILSPESRRSWSPAAAVSIPTSSSVRQST